MHFVQNGEGNDLILDKMLVKLVNNFTSIPLILISYLVNIMGDK